jgi:hypothetical protein
MLADALHINKSTCYQILREDLATREYRGYPSGCDDGAHRHFEKAFTSCFQGLQKRWQQYIDCGGNYFEGDRKH